MTLIRFALASVLLAAAHMAGAQSADPALPDAAYTRARYAKRVARIRMRDGMHLFTQIYVPRDASPSTRFPIVLTRTPFSTGAETDSILPPSVAPDPFMLREGYIFVQQEVRGRYRSEGEFENMRPPGTAADRARGRSDEISDADDTIRWLIDSVPNNSGRVALHGMSYGGFYAAMGALSRHPAIRALSLQAPTADFWTEDFHHNGAFVLTSLWAVPIFGTARPSPTASHWWAPAFGAIPDTAMAHDYEWLLALGSLRNVNWLAQDAWWQALAAHPTRDAFWRARDLAPQLRDLRVPTLLIGGWFDAENLNGTIAVQRALHARSPASPLTYVMGPFGHRQWTATNVGRTMHGVIAFGDSLETHVQRDLEAPFFRARLKGSLPASTRSSAHLFDTGARRWREFPRWPGTEATTVRWNLAPDGSVATTPASAGTRTWTSDPAHPVPARCSGTTIEDGAPNLVMSDDQRCLLNRRDVLTFTSAPFARDLTIAGALKATLRFATSQTDADLVVKLIDVYPDSDPTMSGYHQLVRGEIVRGRFREGSERALPFVSDQPTTVRLTLPDVLHTIKAGHRLEVQVQSSWFPWFDRNPQRFVPNIFHAADADFVSARHTLWLGGPSGSHLDLPILR